MRSKTTPGLWPVICAVMILAMLVITACQQQPTPATARTFAVDVATIAAGVTRLGADLDSAAATVSKNLHLYDANKQERLKALHRELGNIYSQSITIFTADVDVGHVLVAASQIEPLYTQFRALYVEAREIISEKIDQLPESDRKQLVRLDSHMIKLNKSFERLTYPTLSPDGSDITGLVSDLLAVAGLVAKAIN